MTGVIIGMIPAHNIAAFKTWLCIRAWAVISPPASSPVCSLWFPVARCCERNQSEPRHILCFSPLIPSDSSAIKTNKACVSHTSSMLITPSFVLRRKYLLDKEEYYKSHKLFWIINTCILKIIHLNKCILLDKPNIYLWILGPTAYFLECTVCIFLGDINSPVDNFVTQGYRFNLMYRA